MSNEDWNELDESYRSALSGALETAHPAVEQAGGDERDLQAEGAQGEREAFEAAYPELISLCRWNEEKQEYNSGSGGLGWQDGLQATQWLRVWKKARAALAEVERLRQFERICEGLPQDAIDGGWTVLGIRGYAKRLEDQLKSALARVAELEKQEPVALANRGIHAFWVKWTEAAAGLYGPGIKLYAHPVSQAQHSVPEEFSFEYRHPNGECHTVTVSREQVINEMPDFLFEALCSKFCNCEPVGETNVVECCCDEYAEEFKLIAAAPGKEGV
ncbi:hypothetical protein [Pseudomonas aeruginosa]|uniref:hypothetical protein n=1 Tax=Pseudomonas aeruginosa TaxID=287 RepID=UPI001F4A6A6A|nr:hypothetical protein [Pseudomonas aeruginosa]